MRHSNRFLKILAVFFVLGSLGGASVNAGDTDIVAPPLTVKNPGSTDIAEPDLYLPPEAGKQLSVTFGDLIKNLNGAVLILNSPKSYVKGFPPLPAAVASKSLSNASALALQAKNGADAASQGKEVLLGPVHDAVAEGCAIATTTTSRSGDFTATMFAIVVLNIKNFLDRSHADCIEANNLATCIAALTAVDAEYSADEIDCADGFDNNCDRLVDSADPDCQ